MNEESISTPSVEDYQPLVYSIARKLKRRLPAHVQLDELVQAGMVGLLEASRRFDASHGVPFGLYARTRIQGAMLDDIRRADPADRGARRARSLLDQVEADSRRAGAEAPEEAQVAQLLHLPVDDLRRLRRRAQVPQEISLDAQSPWGDERALVDCLASEDEGPEQHTIDLEQRRLLALAVAGLPERERRVVELWVHDGLSLRDIGTAVGVGESQACRIRLSAIRRLRVRLAAAA
jgi:RNA polymerase sigma factor FliA